MEHDLGYTPFEDPQLTEKNYLNTTEAIERAKGMTGIEYTLMLVLHLGNEYLGYLTADFNLSEQNEKLFFDLQGKKVLNYSCNDVVIPQKDTFSKRRLMLPAKYQKVGHNTVKIAFLNDYATNGNGLHHFVDPEDKEEYLYSNFEPFAANKMLPCFDQPNLKASFKLLTVTPPNWVVIANELEKITLPAAEANAKLTELRVPTAFISKELIAGKYVFREFEATPAISSYLFTCIAGPYDLFVSTRKPGEGYPPMRIFVRKSLKKFVAPYADEFFRITECGVKYYEDIFGRKFPFSKHDQIYCPEFNVGAMENVGAVTYTEHYVFKDPPSDEKFMRFAETILHELSHMWFGDLVTMNWWNDLWLNESFATFISNLCMAKAPGLERFRAVWTSFHKGKGWAYREDQEPTTHPITTVVENTEDAENIFDGITYMKGASSLKQLYYLVSHDAFCDGLKEYFQTYQWKNTELKDFLGTMQRALKKRGSSIDLDQWTKQWLCTKGLNELKPEIEIKDKVVSEFKVMQKSAVNGDNVCRMHMTDVAFYDASFNTKIIERVLIEAKPETIVGKIKGMPAPAAVLLNVNDYAYCKMFLDTDSMHAFQKNLDKVSDNLTRMMIWRSFWDMIRDGHASAQEFLKLVVTQAPLEKEEPILTGALGYASAGAVWYIPREYHDIEDTPLYEMLLNRLKTEPSANIKKHLISYVIRFACKSEHKKLLIKWLNEGTGIADAPISQSSRYSIICKIYADPAFSMEEKQKLLARELEKDKSDDGLRAQKSCEAAIPTAENKAKHWKLFLDEKTKESEHMIFSAMGGFTSWLQFDLLKPYVDKFFDEVVGIFEKRSRSYAESFFCSLKPLEVNEEILHRFEELDKKVKEDQKTLKKLIVEEIEDLKRIMRAQKIYSDGLKK